ncbi:hypothetical protein [Nitrosomonas sp. Is37]|uniref:hypothetical protein n=1 Tax=Nitrosomonas sp. Is37 TaxID=3080535 RepID=UPI00294AF01A|nr:hypothetical protein [Nitrosomonas sp. Is37]MDV6345700.1 hypothetical protein [Nitrosomonas sp. Is37]
MARVIFFIALGRWGDGYLWAAIRYVEWNLVQVKMVTKTGDYFWSSIVAHCGLREDAILSQKLEWKKQCDQISNWSA